MKTFMTVMTNTMNTGMTVMMANCFQTMRVNHEKKIMSKAKCNKICFLKTEVIDSFMNFY